MEPTVNRDAAVAAESPSSAIRAVASASSQLQREALRSYWKQASFWPFSLERWIDRHWWLVFGIPMVLFIAVGMAFAPSDGLTFYVGVQRVIQDPYISSLLVALLVSFVFFRLWESSVRETFGSLLERGIVLESGLGAYEAHSARLQRLQHSRWRWCFVALFLVFWGIGCLPNLAYAIHELDATAVAVVALLNLVFGLWAYGVGTVAWCLIATAKWIAEIPSRMTIEVRPGHPDGCGGLRDFGSCCFQAVAPLLVGMVLATTWSYAPELEFFRAYRGNEYPADIAPFCRALVVVLFVLAAAMALLPLLGLHAKMRESRQQQEDAYMARLDRAFQAVDSLKEKDHASPKVVRLLTVARETNPAKVKLGTWPFDLAIMVKFGLSPLLSILISFGKETMKGLAGLK